MSAAPPVPEDQARESIYALLARLYYAPPDADLLRMVSSLYESPAAERDSGFALAWNDLARAAAVAEVHAVREEFEALFVGTGKAAVTLYASAYLTGTAHYQPLVGIRSVLAAHGLERVRGVHEPEDHLAALCEVMRHLVLHAEIAEQKSFFIRYLWPAAGALCDAIIQCEHVNFYRPVAGLTRAFAEVEHAAFQMD